MIQDTSPRKKYPSDAITDDPRRLETQVRVFKKWLNWHLKQANGREVSDVLDIFRDTKNLYYLCKHLLGQKVPNWKEPIVQDATHLDRAVAMLERLYGSEISSCIQATVTEINARQPWDTEAFVRQDWNEPARSVEQNLTILGLDTMWILIVTVCAGTGPATNMIGSISSSGSTVTRRSLSGQPGGQTLAASMISARTPCIDRWLLSQDERLMAWCIAATEGHPGLSITNFTHSWRDGLAFLAIMHQSRPELFAYQTRLEKTANQNLSLAFHLANSEFMTPRLLEPGDMGPDTVDARATATFLLEVRKQIERDRKHRSRGIVEIHTPNMKSADGSSMEPDQVNVTVLSRSSPTSTASTSELTWAEDDDDADTDDGKEEDRKLPDVDQFESMIETTLAWLLAMEERFANNDLHAPDALGKPDHEFNWANYSLTNLRENVGRLNSQLTAEEQADVEALLNSSTDRLKRLHQKILIKIDEATAHFEVHEDLTAHLNRRQMSVGRCLRLGNRLIITCSDKNSLAVIDPTSDTADVDDLQRRQAYMRQRLLALDPDAIQRQNTLLATRWNNLCRINQTMGHRITNCLLRRQGMLLIAIRLQLERLEAEKNRQSEMPIGPSIRELKAQLEANRNLEEGIETGEILAVRLDNFIMLVRIRGDEKEDAAKENNLETIIAELASRWSRLVDWVNTRFAKLQNALLHWRHFDEEVSVLSDWLTERSEEVLRISMDCGRLNEPRKRSLSQSPSLRETRMSGSNLVGQTEEPDRTGAQLLVNDSDAQIEAIEAYLNLHESRWAQLLASVDRHAQALRESCDDTEEVKRIVETTVDRLVSQWSQLAEPQLSVDDWLDRFAKDSANSESEPMVIEDGGKPMGISKSENNDRPLSGAKPGDNKRVAESLLTVPKSPKISCLDVPPSPTGYRVEFETKAEELLNWLDNSAEALELVSMDKNRSSAGQTASLRKAGPDTASAQTDKAERVVKQVSREILEWRETMKRVLTLGERYREELLEAGENVEELDQLFDEVEERWAYLDSLLVKAERHLRVTSNSQQFHLEVSKLLNRDGSPNGEQAKKSDVEVVQAVLVQPTGAAAPTAEPMKDIQTSLTQCETNLSKVDEKLSSPVLFSNPDDLDEQLTHYQELLSDVVKQHEELSAMARLHENYLRDQSELRQRVDGISQNLQETSSKLQSRVSLAQELDKQLEFFMNQLEGLEKWLTEMRYYVDSVSHADLPLINDLQAQLQESCEALKDMDTLEPTLTKVTEVAKQLSDYFRPDYEKVVNDRLSELHVNWNQVSDLINSTREQLEARLVKSLAETEIDSTAQDQTRRSYESGEEVATIVPTQTSEVLHSARTLASAGPGASAADSMAAIRVDVDQLERWMSLSKQKLAEFAVIETQAQLDSLAVLITQLNQEITERRHMLAALDTHTAVSLTNQPLSDTVALLTKAHFADLEAEVGAERERLRGASYHFEDFKTVLGGEQRWFDSLQSALMRVQTMDYMDMMEITDEIESFDRLMEEHSTEDEERLERLVSSLSEAKIMASTTQQELHNYRSRLNELMKDVSRVQNELKSSVAEIQHFESKACQHESALKSANVASSDDWSKAALEAEQVLAEINRKIEANRGAKPLNRFVTQRLQLCYNTVRDALNSKQNIPVAPVDSTKKDPTLDRIRREVESIENQMNVLKLTSIAPTEIQAGMDKAKEMITTMNNLQRELDTVAKSATSPGTDLDQLELVALQEYHRKVVMCILMALGLLEDAMTPAQKLDNLVTELSTQLTGTEEVMDYLDTTDCPVSRRFMLQRIHTDLENLCAKGGSIDMICALVEKMKQIGNSSESIEQALKSIEDRVSRVRVTKDMFHQQLEQINANPEQYTADSCTQPPIPIPENPLLTRIKPSVNQLIENFLHPDTPVSDMVRELTREIRDHFKSIVLFNRYCLGTNAPLPTESVDLARGKISCPLSYETTVSERKAIVKVYFRFTANLFQQQRTYLGDRLRKLIVNAGDDGTNNRLQDLLSLQTAWHETNDKLDRRGEHMANLEQQLSSAEQAMLEYVRAPTDANLTKCETLIRHLEDTYGWKLEGDRERLRWTDNGQASEIPSKSVDVLLLEDGLMGKYEFTLRTIAAHLNDIQFCLELCPSGNLPELRRLLERLDLRFPECRRLLIDAADCLNGLTQDAAKPTEQVGEKRSDVLEADELLWLKILLDTQKNRMDAYVLDYDVHKSAWKLMADHWDAYDGAWKEIKSNLSRLPECESPSMSRELLDKGIRQLKQLKAIEQELTDMLELNPSQSCNGVLSSDDSNASLPDPNTQTTRASAGSDSATPRWHVTSMKSEINTLQQQLEELCNRYRCQDLLGKAISPVTNNETKLSETELRPALSAKNPLRSSAEMMIEDEATLVQTLGELGSYTKDVAACLHGLAKETHWLTQRSGLVPAGLIKRQSDDILLANATATPKSKPTTAAELGLDVAFWHSDQGTQADRKEAVEPVEFTPTWVKAKWADLETLIETTFEHEKHATAWCRKASQLARLLRNANDPSPLNSAHTKAVSRLESGSNKLSEALSVAQAALNRRRSFLTGWQSNLVELETRMDEIKSFMSSYDLTGLDIEGETPNVWLANLRNKLAGMDASTVKEQFRDEFDPRNDGIGKYLDALQSSWSKVLENLSTPEQATMLVRVPVHMSNRIDSLLQEWDALKAEFNFSVEKPVASTDQRSVSLSRGLTTSATLVRAPNAWPPTDSEASAMDPRSSSTTGGATVTTSPTLTRLRHEVEQLTRWLTAVTDFAMHSRAVLGDRFDQERMNKQLQDAQRVISEGYHADIPRVYHPAALQLKLQQFLTELNARRPQLDRIQIEKDRLSVWDAQVELVAEFRGQSEQLPQLWANAENQMTRRAMELELMIADTQRLKELEREVDRWITKAELELDALISGQTFDETNELAGRPSSNHVIAHRRLQDLLNSVPTGQDKLDQYAKESAELSTRFQSEETGKIKQDLEQMNDRWNNFNQRLHQTAESIHAGPAPEDLPIETERVAPVLARAGRSSSRDRQRQAAGKLPEKLDSIEQKVARITEMHSDLQRQSGANDPIAELTDQRALIVNELQALQNEIGQLFAQLSGTGTRPSNPDLSVPPDREFLNRLRELRDKVTTLRQGLQGTTSHNKLFLARLKSLNDWVVHQDAAFRAIVCPLTGNLLFILKLREMVLNLMTELETKRAPIEDALQQGRIRYEDSNAPGFDSEPESDGAEGSDADGQSKRTVRRIRRHLSHLKQRWFALNEHVLDYKQQLDSVSERLSNFHSLFNDTVEQIRSAHSVTLRWAPIQSVPFDRLGSELEQTQTFYEACAPLTVLLNSLDRQVGQFHDAQITIDSNVLTEFAALRIDLDQIRSLTEARMDELNRSLARSMQQPITPYSQSSLMQTSPDRPQLYSASPVAQDLVDLRQTKMHPDSQLPSTPQSVPLSDSVSFPWERCVHPSGTQVPYYKNHSTQDTQWDHPLVCEMMQTLKEFNTIRFPEYRTALKLRKLQKVLCLDSLSISVLAENLKHIGHTQLTGAVNTDPFDRFIYVPQMIECLTKLFNLSANSDQEPKASHSNRQSFIRCGSGFRRGTSQREPQYLPRPTGPVGSHPALPHAAGQTDETSNNLAAGNYPSGENRSTSLPDTGTVGGQSPTLIRTSMRRRRSSSRTKRRLTTNPTKYPINVCVDLTLNWLLNVYDRMRKGHIRALSFKVALVALCMADLVDKYRYLFSLIADTNGNVNEQRLGALLYECVLIPRNLGEGYWVGKEDFTNKVKACYAQVMELARENDSSSISIGSGIPVRHFITWLRLGTPHLSWLPLLHRMMLAEQVVHHVRCRFCHQTPIVGLRYRCLWCLNFDLCQQCFFRGRISRAHKLTHPMQEYCVNSTSGDSIRDFTRIVRNRLRSRDRTSQPDTDRDNAGTKGRSRGRCCDATKFADDKPRPAPVHVSDLGTLVSVDRTTPSPYDTQATNRSISGLAESIGPSRSSQLQPGRTDTGDMTIRPMSSQLVANARKERGGLPPRAASDTRHLIKDNNLTGKPPANDRVDRLTEPVPDDEHRLIALYSQELRQQSETDLDPTQSLNHQVHIPSVPPLMDRSTISEGPPTGITGFLPQGTGHLSLDRRQWNRSPGYIPPYGGPSGYLPDLARTQGRYTGFEQQQQQQAFGSRMEPQSAYRSARQFGMYPLSSNPALHRATPYSSFGANGIQRSYSMRAQSQPPSELAFNPTQPTQNSQLDSRWYPTGLPPQASLTNKMRSLDEERRALQFEYERLRLSPARNVTYGPMLTRTPVPQQRFTRSPMQQPILPPPQQDYLRSNLARTYNPRLPVHRPPSAGPPLLNTGTVYPNVATLPGRLHYNGSLGRANSLTNGFHYPADIYGSEPRVAGTASYGFDMAGEYGLSTNPSGPGSEIASEARLLRAHRGRLELRMQQLEDQNKQLEQKLQRLRQYLVSGSTDGGTDGGGSTGVQSHFGQTTLASVGRSSADSLQETSNPLSKSTLRQRSASGGLAGQLQTADERYARGSGSIGHLPTPMLSDTRQVASARNARGENAPPSGSSVRPSPAGDQTSEFRRNGELNTPSRSNFTNPVDPHPNTSVSIQSSRYP